VVRRRRLTLATAVQLRWPDWDEETVALAIASGNITVAGVPVTNPASVVAADAVVRHAPPPDLHGRQKLAWAIARFELAPVVDGSVALDVGASAGGFTTALLDAGAARVYAVDVGHSQLRGSLRQDPRVVNLERTNVADLTAAMFSEPIEVVSVDVSYLSLSSAVSQLSSRVPLAAGAVLLGLVKPMFELRLPTITADPGELVRAVASATAGAEGAGWQAARIEECPVRGARGAVELFVVARRP